METTKTELTEYSIANRRSTIDSEASKFMYVNNQSKPYFSRPWMAYVWMYSKNDKLNQCGGAIINEKYISNDTDNIVRLPPCNDAQHTYTFYVSVVI